LSLEGRWILADIALNVAAGRTVALLGANGAGKSTLLRVLATLTPSSAGELRLFGRPAGRMSAEARSRIGLIAHQPMLYRDLSVRENLVFFGRLYDLPDPAGRAGELLELVQLAHRSADPVKTLSRGMVQRVSIARAMMHDPALLLADEPFDGLDAPAARTLEGLLAELRAAGKTLIFSNHDIRQSLAITDDVVVLDRGRVAIDGPAAALTAEAVLQEIAGA